MGFFSNSNSVASTANLEDLLREDNLEIYEGMSIMEANYASIAVTEMNWNAIMEAAATTEMQYFAEHGEEYVYTEASGFFSKISEFFKKIWEKIKALFKKFMVMIGGLVSKDKDFVKKYRETINRNLKNIPSDATMKGYNYTIGSAPSGYVDIQDEIGKLGEKIKMFLTENGQVAANAPKYITDKDAWDSSDAAEECRAIAVGKTNERYTDKEFRDFIFESLRDGQDSPDDIDIKSTTVTNALIELENAKGPRKDAEKAYRNAEKSFKNIIKTAEKVERDGYKKDPNTGKSTMDADGLASLNNAISCAKNIANYGQTMSAMLLTAVKEKYNQYKRMCVKVVTYKNVKEGATIEHFSEGGAFAEVNLI